MIIRHIWLQILGNSDYQVFWKFWHANFLLYLPWISWITSQVLKQPPCFIYLKRNHKKISKSLKQNIENYEELKEGKRLMTSNVCKKEKNQIFWCSGQVERIWVSKKWEEFKWEKQIFGESCVHVLSLLFIHEWKWLKQVSLPHNETNLLVESLTSACFLLCSAALMFLGSIGQHLRCILDEAHCASERFCYQRKEGNEKEVWGSDNMTP